MEVWSRVTRLARRLDRDRAKAFSQWDLEGWEFDVLAALRRSGEPYQLSPGQLLNELEVASGTMTNRITRLSNRGLVRRLPHPKDGRGVIVELTDEGRDRVDGAWQPCWSPRDVCSTRWMPRSLNRWVKVYVPCWPVMRNWTEGFLSRCDG
ncbi:transcriptional regulator [Cutibacterium acnes JCM 18909]|nr:transcriptional regulator [Cutibacterium acnes JCM 18909]